MLILNQADVTRALSIVECIEGMRDALGSLARGRVTMPLRTYLRLPSGAATLGAMPAYDDSTGAFGIKILAVFKQSQVGRDSHQGAVLLFDSQTGALQAILDATSITAIRTAAVSAVATDLLANAGADDLAILGAGTQAATHLEAIRLVRHIRRVRVWSRDWEKTRQFAEAATRRFGCEVEPMALVSDALRHASIVCTTTGTKEPIVQREWLAPGAHVNAIGSSVASTRELDTRTIMAASLFVDRRESTLNEAGDFLIPANEGAITPEHIRAELGDVIIGKHPGRTSPGELTVFKSLGLGIEDVAAGRIAVARARELGLGVQTELGGVPQNELSVRSSE